MGTPGADSRGVHTYKNLEFYQQARTLAVDIYRIVRRFPKDDATRVAARQFVAAATSIRANIAEGHGRYSRAAYRNHLSIARRSATETQDWADFLQAVDLLSTEEERDIHDRCERLIASFTRAMKCLSVDPAAPARKIGEEQAGYAAMAISSWTSPSSERWTTMLPCSIAPCSDVLPR